MFQKIVLIKVLLTFLITNFFDQTNCESTERLLSCTFWNESFGYEQFEINFYYSTREQKPQNVTPEKIISGGINIDLTKRTVVIVHGLSPSLYIDLMYNLRTAFLEWSDINIIYVDWEAGCATPLRYRQSSRNTEYAAIRIRDFFQYLMRAWNGTDKSKEYWGPLHFIGLSLGAHVVGQAGELLKDGGQPLVYRVTGLDPSEPCFNVIDSPLRIRKSNAEYVDIIHTDVARSYNTGLGLFEPIGHVDFYVNGGSSQPGCSSRQKKELNLFRIGHHMISQSGLCHHLRSIELFTQSLKNDASKQCKFWAHPWKLKQLYKNTPPRRSKKRAGNTTIEMGINAELYHRHGVFYVNATGTPPFCQA